MPARRAPCRRLLAAFLVPDDVRKWLVAIHSSSTLRTMERASDFDRRVLHRARKSRDRRFDGRFFIAVTSTGIYCRPICPAPSPKESNVRYYPSAVAAAEAGFRPCLRCRPEAAPGTPAWMGTSTVVRRAIRLARRSDGRSAGSSGRHRRKAIASALHRARRSVAHHRRANTPSSLC
jgi:methylphosphotriester-DNA--protein-cysteine methyltransferase